MIGSRARKAPLLPEFDIRGTPINGDPRHAPPPMVAGMPSIASPVTQPPVSILGPDDDRVPLDIGDMATRAPVNERPAWSKGPEGLYKPGIAGMLQKLGDGFHAPGMSAALLRSGAATLQGGLGAGIEAGARYMDQRKASEAAAARDEVNDAFQTRKLDQTDTQLANALGIDLAKLQEDIRGNKTRETLQARDQGIRVSTANADRGQRERESQREFFIKKYGIDVGENSANADRQLKAAGIRVDSEDRRYIADRAAETRVTVAQTPRPAGVGSKANAKPSAAMQKAAVVLPAGATADDLSVGTVYRTPRGLGQWDGAKFVPVQ